MRPDPDALRGLLSRLGAADRGSVELDAAVHRALMGPIELDVLAGAHTTSLDGAVVLVERHGFGWWVDGAEGCTLSDADDCHDVARGATPPLSVCAALAKALLARAETEKTDG